MAETAEARRARDRARYHANVEKQRERKRKYYLEHREEINRRKRETRKAKKAQEPPKARERWKAVGGWEERYQAEELAKYGPPTEEVETRTPEELEEMRLGVYRALGIWRKSW